MRELGIRMLIALMQTCTQLYILAKGQSKSKIPLGVPHHVYGQKDKITSYIC